MTIPSRSPGTQAGPCPLRVRQAIFDGTWQDGWEDVVQFWHDEGGPDSFKISPAEGKSSVLSSASDETRTRKVPVSSGIRPGSARRRALVKEFAALMKESAGFREGACGPRERACYIVKISCSCSTSSTSSQRKGILCLRLVRRCLGPARACILVGSFETTDERFEVEVPSTAVMDMSGVSAGTSVSTGGRCAGRQLPADTAR